MTREEIIRLAEEAGFQVERLSVLDREVVEIWFATMIKFAELVAAAEREAMRQDGWRRCAEGQGETQHCALLEAAVLAEREACAAICAREARHYGKIPDLGHYQQGRGEGATSIEKKIRERGQE